MLAWEASPLCSTARRGGGGCPLWRSFPSPVSVTPRARAGSQVRPPPAHAPPAGSGPSEGGDLTPPAGLLSHRRPSSVFEVGWPPRKVST